MSVTAQQTSPLLLMVGLPDDMLVNIWSDRRTGNIMHRIPGVVRLTPEEAPQLERRLLRIVFGPRIELRLPPALQGKEIINAVAEPDISAISLQMLARFLSEMHVGCFNHPLSVLDCSRERVAAKLGSLPGMQVPRTIKLRIDEPADLLHAAAEHGIGYPMIVRVAGTHRGSATAKIDCADQTKPALRGIAWGGHDLYLTEYIDYRDQDGLFRKMRLVVVGKKIFLRHLVIADDWQIHAHDRHPGHLEEELAALEGFETNLLPKIRPTLLAVAEAMDMDYFGMDCCLRPDGRLLMFETNALMDILINTMASPNCWNIPIKHIHGALEALLFDPTRWRHPARRSPKAA